MDIKQQIEVQKKWIEIGEDTIEQLIEEGQPQEIIKSEQERLEEDKKVLNELLKQLS